jgi:hypothetical protein
MKALKERMKPIVEEMRTLEEKEMQDFLSCFKKD